MKKVFLILILSLLYISCSKDNEKEQTWVNDFVPVFFNIEVVDSVGNNLMDTTKTVNNRDFVKMTYIEFQGKSYHLGETINEEIKPSTRAYYEPFHGITLQKKQGKYLAVIGPFLGNLRWNSENIDIHWGNGTIDNVKFTYLVNVNSNGEFNEEKVEYLFNGADSTSTFRKKGYIRLVKSLLKR